MAELIPNLLHIQLMVVLLHPHLLLKLLLNQVQLQKHHPRVSNLCRGMHC